MLLNVLDCFVISWPVVVLVHHCIVVVHHCKILVIIMFTNIWGMLWEWKHLGKGSSNHNIDDIAFPFRPLSHTLNSPCCPVWQGLMEGVSGSE